MLSFESDYIQGAHPLILEKLVSTNMEQLSGYGDDKYCASAKEKIKAACQCPEADIHFLVGGTQSNAVVIDTMLASYEGVLSAETGHVNCHEAGAIERTGHKVLALPAYDGKAKAQDMKAYLEKFYGDESHTHMVFPGMLYISHPTEYGTLYTLDELTELSELCHSYNIPLYLDGARLGYGLMSLQTDVTLADIARLCDVFYIGGTKVGALCGEAVVFTKNNTPKYFLTQYKSHGALLAKGRLLGIQFDTLFTDDLYLKLGKNAIDRAEEVKAIVREKGYEFLIDSPTNQQFIIVEDDKLAEIRKEVCVCFWEKVDETHTAVRIATSWATTAEDVQKLQDIL